MTIGLSMLRSVRVLGASLVALLALTGVSELTRSHGLHGERTPLVVFLHTTSQGSPEQEPPRGLVTPQQQPLVLEPIQEGLGPGVLIDASDLILTNAHVIEAADPIHVPTPDGDEGDATVVGTDPELDLALLRVGDLTGLLAAPLGDSDRVNVGDWVVAIGNPVGITP